MNTKVAVIPGAAAFFAAPSSSNAVSLTPVIETLSTITLVAGSCGHNAWRGPYGGCRITPCHGRLLDGGGR